MILRQCDMVGAYVEDWYMREYFASIEARKHCRRPWIKVTRTDATLPRDSSPESVLRLGRKPPAEYVDVQAKRTRDEASGAPVHIHKTELILWKGKSIV